MDAEMKELIEKIEDYFNRSRVTVNLTFFDLLEVFSTNYMYEVTGSLTANSTVEIQARRNNDANMVFRSLVVNSENNVEAELYYGEIPVKRKLGSGTISFTEDVKGKILPYGEQIKLVIYEDGGVNQNIVVDFDHYLVNPQNLKKIRKFVNDIYSD